MIQRPQNSLWYLSKSTLLSDGYSVTSGKTEQQKAFLGEYLKPLVIWESLEMGVSLSSKQQQTVPSRMQSSTY